MLESAMNYGLNAVDYCYYSTIRNFSKPGYINEHKYALQTL